MDNVEFLILRNLLYNEEYLRKVIPFIKSEYFEELNQKIIFEEISNFVGEYNELVTKEALCIEIEKRTDGTPYCRIWGNIETSNEMSYLLADTCRPLYQR